MANHVTIDGFGGSPDLLRDSAVTYELLQRLPRLLGMKVLYGPHIEYYDGGDHPMESGVTGFTIIAESHIAVHAWTSLLFVEVDVFSCREFDPEVVKHAVYEAYQLSYERSRMQEVERSLGVMIEAVR